MLKWESIKGKMGLQVSITGWKHLKIHKPICILPLMYELIRKKADFRTDFFNLDQIQGVIQIKIEKDLLFIFKEIEQNFLSH